MLWPKERVNTLVMLRCCASYVETFLTDTMHETLAGVCDVKIEIILATTHSTKLQWRFGSHLHDLAAELDFEESTTKG